MGIEQVTKIQLICGKAYGADGRALANHKGWFYLLPEEMYEDLFKPEIDEELHSMKMSEDLKERFPGSMSIEDVVYDLDPTVDIVPKQAIIVRYLTLSAELDELYDQMKQDGELGGD